MEARYPRPTITLGVKTALWSAAGGQQPADPASQACELKTPDGRAIHVADGVRSALDGIDIQAIVAKVSIGPRHCFSCRLPIADRGQAEMMILRAGAEAPLLVTLAHRTCARSAIVQVPSMPPEATTAIFDVERLMLDEATPAVVVDSHSPWGLDESKSQATRFLTCSGRLGSWTHPLSSLWGLYRCSTSSPSHRSARHLPERLWQFARQENRNPQGQDFLPACWYQATRGGTLIAMFGNNLQGLVSDDDQYLIKAIESGNLVVAAIKLDVTPPSRNDQCVCEPRTHKKYKHCCGRPPSAQAG